MRKVYVEEIKEIYKKGVRLKLLEMKGESDMARGLQGEVDFVDDIGQIHVNWDNGRTLALIPGEDIFKIVG